ncbi:MAG: hypothetical protein CVU87_08135 [Firmicutes bacterium HGW-Firmicutes-12]|nr:MAG: hypothetical protein CVU87_08135 [Firmicutes bacterium HGW-Firmicutes-12]
MSEYDSYLTICNTCGKEILKTVLSCPFCGTKLKKKNILKWVLFSILGLTSIFLIIGIFIDSDDSVGINTIPVVNKTNNETKAPVAPLPKKEADDWNISELDAMENGNIMIALKKLKSNGDIADRNVFKRPWDFYGKVVRFSGLIYIVQDYPPGSDLSEQFGGSAAEVVLETDDGTIVDILVSGTCGKLKVGDITSVYGYPVGLAEVPNELGGNTTQLIVVSSSKILEE